MKVLFHVAQFYPSLGGVETFALELATGLWEAGHELVLVTETPTDQPEPVPFPVIRTPGPRELLRLVADADVLYMNGHRVGLLLLATLLRKKTVMVYHDITMICPKGDKMRGGEACMEDMHLRMCGSCLREAGELKIVRRLLRPSIKTLLSHVVHANVCISAFAAETYPLARKRHIRYGVDTNLFVPGEREGDRETARLVFVGRLVPEKGGQLLLPAVRELLDRGHSVHLDVCGDGPYRPTLQGMVNRLDLASHVTFWGAKRGEALVHMLQQADVAVVPSLWVEQFGITAVEAMSCGLPVIGSDSGGLGRILAEGGVVFERGNLTELTDRLEQLVTDPGTRDRLGARAREIAIRKYDRRTMTRAHLRLIGELAGAGSKQYRPLPVTGSRSEGSTRAESLQLR
jgi:glycogen(starch) synthase